MTPGGRRTGDDLRVAPPARPVRVDVPGQEGGRVGRAGVNLASKTTMMQYPRLNDVQLAAHASIQAGRTLSN